MTHASPFALVTRNASPFALVTLVAMIALAAPAAAQPPARMHDAPALGHGVPMPGHEASTPRPRAVVPAPRAAHARPRVVAAPTIAHKKPVAPPLPHSAAAVGGPPATRPRGSTIGAAAITGATKRRKH